MLFRDFFSKVLLVGKKTIRRKKNLPLLNPSQDEYTRLLKTADEGSPELSLLEINDNFKTKNELNKALDSIDRDIAEQGLNNQLLLQKADIYLRRSKFNKARQILYKICKDKSNSKISNLAKRLLLLSHQLQKQENLQKQQLLIADLNKIAQKYNVKLSNLPKTKESTPDLDITQLVREQARKARANDLPMLSHELIARTLQTGAESPWLLHGKALSLSMTGQKTEAIDLLEKIKATNSGAKITQAVNESIKNIKKKTKSNQAKINFYLAIQSKAIAASKNLDTEFIPKISKINETTRIKFLVFRKARAILVENPKATLDLVDSILDYFRDDSSALLLRGEALSALNKSGEAIDIWAHLTRCEDKSIGQKASELISQHFSQKAKKISKNKSIEEALSFFFQQHIKHSVAPSMNEDIKQMLKQLDPSASNFSDPELEQHQLQLLFNTQLLDCLEAQLSEQGRLGGTSPAQKPGAIGKTAPRAG